MLLAGDGSYGSYTGHVGASQISWVWIHHVASDAGVKLELRKLSAVAASLHNMIHDFNRIVHVGAAW